VRLNAGSAGGDDRADGCWLYDAISGEQHRALQIADTDNSNLFNGNEASARFDYNWTPATGFCEFNWYKSPIPLDHVMPPAIVVSPTRKGSITPTGRLAMYVLFLPRY